MRNIGNGTLALCSGGWLGLITSDEPERVEYPDGNSGLAWTGIHLTEGNGGVGAPWSSRNPLVVGHLEDVVGDTEENHLAEVRQTIRKIRDAVFREPDPETLSDDELAEWLNYCAAMERLAHENEAVAGRYEEAASRLRSRQ